MLNLQAASLDWALDHALNYGDTDLFPHCFEFEAIRHEWANVRPYLESVDLDTWQVRPHRQCLAPKGRYSFRVATQLDPLDFLLFTALVYEIGPSVEAARVDTDREVVFSYRFRPEPDGRMFATDVGYTDFVARTRDLIVAAGVTHVAIADIADFYPRVYHHPLENALAAENVSADHVRCVMKLLSGWSSYVSHGLPVQVIAHGREQGGVEESSSGQLGTGPPSSHYL